MRLRRLLLRIVPILLFSALAPSKRIGEFRNFADKSSGGSSVLFFLSLFFFFFYRGRKEKEWKLVARTLGWRESVVVKVDSNERTRTRCALFRRKTFFEDFTGESKHQSERWVVLFDPPIIIRHQSDRNSILAPSSKQPSKENPFTEIRKDSVSLEEIIRGRCMKLKRLFYGYE